MQQLIVNLGHLWHLFQRFNYAGLEDFIATLKDSEKAWCSENNFSYAEYMQLLLALGDLVSSFITVVLFGNSGDPDGDGGFSE